MDNIVNIDEVLKEKHRELLVNKNSIDLETAMESFLLFYNNRCDVIFIDVVDVILSRYIVNADPSKKEEAKLLIRSFFDLYKSSIEKAVKDKTIEVKDSINNIEQDDYGQKQLEMKEAIIDAASSFYFSNVVELINTIKACDTTCPETIDIYLRTVFKTLIDEINDKLKYSIGTINNNFEANISHIEEINARTLNKAA